MYHAKDQGRNNYQFYSTPMNERACRAPRPRGKAARGPSNMTSSSCISSRRPPLATGRITGLEALLRWRNPRSASRRPIHPVAEATGFIPELGEWVIRQAWGRSGVAGSGLRTPSVAVNISVAQFPLPGFPETLAALARERWSIPRCSNSNSPRRPMRSPEDAIQHRRAASALGFRVAIDDFGTGYSSLSYLKRLGAKR